MGSTWKKGERCRDGEEGPSTLFLLRLSPSDSTESKGERSRREWSKGASKMMGRLLLCSTRLLTQRSEQRMKMRETAIRRAM